MLYEFGALYCLNFNIFTNVYYGFMRDLSLIYCNFMVNMMSAINRAIHIDGWLTKDNPIYKWMMTGGTLILGNLHFRQNNMISDVSQTV